MNFLGGIYFTISQHNNMIFLIPVGNCRWLSDFFKVVSSFPGSSCSVCNLGLLFMAKQRWNIVFIEALLPCDSNGWVSHRPLECTKERHLAFEEHLSIFQKVSEILKVYFRFTLLKELIHHRFLQREHLPCQV